MCHFGGPTGTNADLASRPTLLHHYGNGLLLGDVLRARTALALGTSDPDSVLATGAALPGDSGGPVTSAADGRALGVLVAVGVAFGQTETGGLDAGPVIVTRIAPQEARAEQVLGTALTLQTADPL